MSLHQKEDFMTEIAKPVLSILLPTFNRASILRLTLKHLLSEVERLKGRVEVVIGNNASTDETDTVLAELTSEYSSVVRRETNIGAWRNIVALANEARGDWVWILGDDDFLVPYSLEKIVSSINNSGSIDLICINHGWIEVNRLQAALEKGEKIEVSDQRQWEVTQDTDFKIGTEIFDVPSPVPAGSFSALFGFTVRRHVFREHASRIKHGSLTDGFNELNFSLEDAFPHSIVALEIVGKKPMKLLADVCVLQGVGGWGWKRFLYRTVILGHVWLFLRFESVIPESAWLTLGTYAGTRMARMKHDPESNFGFIDIEKAAVPILIYWPTFCKSFSAECEHLDMAHEGMVLLQQWKDNMRKEPLY